MVFKGFYGIIVYLFVSSLFLKEVGFRIVLRVFEWLFGFFLLFFYYWMNIIYVIKYEVENKGGRIVFEFKGGWYKVKK